MQELLSHTLNVIGPVLDGGYYFLGLQQCQPALFSGMAWGGADVLRETLRRAGDLGIELTPLAALRDIDYYDDLVAAAEIDPRLRRWIKPRDA